MAVSPVNVASGCAGIAGIDLGLRLAIPSARSILYLENEITAVSKLVARMEDKTLDAAPVWSDARTFDGRPWRGLVDIWAAGFPCQPFSCAGRKRAARDRRHLWPHIRRIADEFEAPVCFFENVDALLSRGYEQVERELRGDGFTVEAGIFSARECGASHIRKRLFILAYRESRGLGIVRQSSASACGFADRRDPQLDNALRERYERPQTEILAGRRGPLVSGATLADADRRTIRHAQRPAQKRTGPESAGAIVADSRRHDGRREFESSRAPRKANEFERGNTRSGSAGSYPLFPPGPNEFEKWSRVLESYPEIEPAVCRVPDGSADRVDRLRATGNGVVPLVAAYAFLSLARAAAADLATR